MLKSDIRKEFKEKREQFSLEEKNDKSRKIAQVVARIFDLESKVVSIFLPIERLNEVNTTFLIDVLKNANAVISSPVSDFKSFELKHVIYNDKTIFKINEWGIPEPTNGDEIMPEALDLVFVPLLVSDEKGYRVGYGKGFYDRFLSQCSDQAIFIGLNYFNEVVPIEDINKDDIPVHFIVTPDKVLKF